MRKEELIKKLQAIEGNGEVFIESYIRNAGVTIWRAGEIELDPRNDILIQVSTD